MSSSDQQIKFIYDLPYIEREKFCLMLNQGNKWEELAGMLKLLLEITTCIQSHV